MTRLSSGYVAMEARSIVRAGLGLRFPDLVLPGFDGDGQQDPVHPLHQMVWLERLRLQRLFPELTPPPSSTSVTSRSCVVVHCVRCGQNVSEQERDFTPHYDSLAEARSALEEAGWTWPEHDQAVCPNCQVRLACAEQGHLWCLCGGRIVQHGTPCTWQVRWCDRFVGDGAGSCLNGRDERPAAASAGARS